ncbi:MAG: hypothetical protein MJB57_12260 [Gemmatimonadetes bacterium]|nr:hypothetical protein [Gemmatimonadota bacterium]
MGVEVSLTPAGGQTHRPETNGVTAFSLTDYCDSDRYRDVAFATVVGLDRAARDRIVDAAMNPNTARTRYPLYEALGPWLHHVYSPAGCQNPLEAGIAHPGAAFCEMAYEAGGLDLTPGAVGPNVCPEMLWSTFRYWHESLPRDKGKVVVWTTARPNEIHVDRRYVAESVEASLEGHRPRR